MSLVTSKDEKEEKGRKITTIIMIIIFEDKEIHLEVKTKIVEDQIFH